MILITGATGFTGSHLLFYLLAKGEKIRAIYRNKKSFSKVLDLFALYHPKPQEIFEKIEWVQADITDIITLENDVFDNIDYVYHLAAKVDFSSKGKKIMTEVNVEGTKNILTLSKENNVKKLLHVSSIASLGSYDYPITEKTHWNWKEKSSYYAQTKYLSEMEVWRATQESLDAIIVNPSVILGAGFWNEGSAQIFNKVYNGLNFYPSGSTGFIDVWDVVKSMVILMNSSIKNDSFLLSSTNLSFREFLNLIAKNFNRPIPKKELKKWMIYPLMPINKISETITRNEIINQDVLHSLFTKTYYSSDKFLNKFDVNFIPIEHTIRNICEKFILSQNKQNV